MLLVFGLLGFAEVTVPTPVVVGIGAVALGLVAVALGQMLR
jgi:hypothetical protein